MSWFDDIILKREDLPLSVIFIYSNRIGAYSSFCSSSGRLLEYSFSELQERQLKDEKND